jgi:hypothetical protein
LILLPQDLPNVVPPLSYYQPVEWGWRSQQVQKLTVSKHMDDDYLVLDTKSFFVKPVDSEEWRNVLGNGRLVNIDDVAWNNTHELWDKTNNIYAKIFNTSPLTRYLDLSPPFKIRIKPLKEFDRFDNIGNLILYSERPEHSPVQGPPSEFMFYSYLVKDEVESLPNSMAFYNKRCDIFSRHVPVLNELLNADYNVYAFHHTMMSSITEDDRNTVNKWLADLNFTFRL